MKWKATRRPLHCYQNTPRSMRCFLLPAVSMAAPQCGSFGAKRFRPWIIAFDLVPTTRQMLENGTIAAIICQQPKIQGSKPLSLLFAYLTTGETPEKEYNYTAVDIRIKENL